MEHGPAGEEGPVASQPASTRDGGGTLTVGPITFFQQSCARCHGPFGSMYDQTLGKAGDATLRADVVRMVEGPAQKRLGTEEIDALVAYHRALADERAFVIVTAVLPDHLEIEATPGVVPCVESDGERVPAERVSEWSWRAPRPGSGSASGSGSGSGSPMVVVATGDGAELRCEARVGAAAMGPAR
ncbi:MAG: hypothetical protein AB7G11_06975 [Phycisphaerales bacterium]